MKAVSATTVTPGHNSASAPNTIAARPRSKNSHQWWRTEAAISSASISTSTCAGDLELGAVYGQVVGLQKSLEMVDGPFDNNAEGRVYSVEDAGDARKPSTCWITAASLTMR